MLGSLCIRPIEAKLFRDVEFFKKMDPYCLVSFGDSIVKGTICKKGGKHPVWDDIVVFKMTNDPTCIIQLMDKDTLTADDTIGVCEIDIQEVEEEGRVLKWYELHYKRRLAGEILIEAAFMQEDSSQDALLYVGKKLSKKEIVRQRTGKKAAAKHIISYQEKKLRPVEKASEKSNLSYFQIDSSAVLVGLDE